MTQGAAPTQLAERFVAMGTRVECHLFATPDAADVAAMLRRAVEAVDDALTIHRPSPATTVNDRLRSEGRAAVDDPILWDTLLLCDDYRKATGGLFDPTAGMADAGWDAIEFDRPNARLRAAQPTAFDFGGIGKGVALDRCLPILAAGSPSALISLGESSILAHGEHPLGGDWPLTVPHPESTGDALVTLAVRDRCLSISSTVGRANGETLNPGDGAPVLVPRTAVAIDPSGARAEAYSTASIVAGRDWAARLDGGCEALHLFDHQAQAEDSQAAGV